ncbi:hypothetical protein P154DRAFT_527760 [Amniculicola lignicola CBS 123094]|uniref:Clr5 domain-containing protein n=1 Tax=Amniculicola lignicola CBS 123094 TaxID=1392246 RepID=A0A6A5VVM0_9PLEO|nr:hypothetical protein P154DRAFT_527760 [Amniculicola lignicola CBS 123094]
MTEHQETDSSGTSPASSEDPKPKRQAHTPAMWAKIQPTLKYYYITMDMTLEEAMQKIVAEHDFHATENMYKKRLKTWGLTKHTKATEKEKALARILQNGPLTGDPIPIRHDKLVRYAKSRVKSGALGSHHLKQITKRNTAGRTVPHIVSPVTIAARTPAVPQSVEPRGQFAELDLFLRAQRVLVEKERKEFLAGPRGSPLAIFLALRKGLTLWRNQAFAAARMSFGEAAQMTMEDLQGNEVSVSRITCCISSIVWGSEHEPVFLKFAEFMMNAALEVLGPQSAMTIVLTHLQTEPSIETQVRIWESSSDNYEISEENVLHWWSMAQRRWRWSVGCEKWELAARCCRHAMSEARRINRLRPEMEAVAQSELDVILARLREL